MLKNTVANVVISESFLDEFLQWANTYLLDKAKRHQFKKNILRHIGPESNYAGRQNILNILHALYQFTNNPNHGVSDLKTSIVSRIEERALNCSPGFETGICDMAQAILCVPKSIDELLQLVREDIVKKNAMILTDDVHGQNEVFRLAGPIYAVSLANPSDPYNGHITLEQIKTGIHRDFEVFYHSIKLIDALKEQFLTVIQGFGYIENQIDAATHTKIGDYIQTIFSLNPQVINLNKAQSYHASKKVFEKNALVMVSTLLATQGYFDLSVDEQNDRLKDLMGDAVPDWLPEDLHEELISAQAIQSRHQRQEEIKVFFHSNQLYQVDVHVKNTKIKAVYELANVPSSYLVWAKSLSPKLLEEIVSVRQQTQIMINQLDKPQVSLVDARLELDEWFWLGDDSVHFPYQRLNFDHLLIAFLHELSIRKSIQVHAWFEMVVFENSAGIRKQLFRQIMDHVLVHQGMKNFIDLLALISIYGNREDLNLENDLETFLLTIFNQSIQENMVSRLLHLCFDFKLSLSFVVLAHPKALKGLEPCYFIRLLRCLKEKDAALKYIEAYYLVHPNTSIPYQKLLAAIAPHLRFKFLQKYVHLFVQNGPQFIEVLKKLPPQQRLLLVKMKVHLLSEIKLEIFLSICDLLVKQDKFALCELMHSHLPLVFMDKASNLMILKKINVEFRYPFILNILGPKHYFFNEVVVETFHFWKKKDKLSFLNVAAFIENFSLEQLYKILLKAPVALAEKRCILDVFLTKQAGNFELFYLFKFEQLLKDLGLDDEEGYLKHYAYFIIRNTFSAADTFTRMLNAFDDRERFDFLSTLSDEFKDALVKQQLIAEAMATLAPNLRLQYLKSFSMPYHELLRGEHNLLKTFEVLINDEKILLLSEMRTSIGEEVNTGIAFERLVNAVKDLFPSFEACIASLIRDYGLGNNISEGFFDYALTWNNAFREKMFVELGSKLTLMLDKHSLPMMFERLKTPQQETFYLRLLMQHMSSLRTKNVAHFVKILPRISPCNINLFFDFFVDFLSSKPMSFAEFFDFIDHIFHHGLRQAFISLLSKTHFSLDESKLAFYKLIQMIHVKLNRKLSSPLFILFQDELSQLIKTSEELYAVLQSATPKDKIWVLEKLAPQLPGMMTHFNQISKIIHILDNHKHRVAFIHYLQPRIFEIVTEIEHACLLAKQLDLDEQLPFLQHFHFSKEKLQQFASISDQDMLIRLYLLICWEQSSLDGHGLFEVNYLHLLSDMRAILCEPKRFTPEEIALKIRALPEHLGCYFESSTVHLYLMERQAEPHQAKRMKSI